LKKFVLDYIEDFKSLCSLYTFFIGLWIDNINVLVSMLNAMSGFLLTMGIVGNLVLLLERHMTVIYLDGLKSY